MSITEATPCQSVDTTCAYCGVGCGVSAQIAEEQIIAVEGATSHPANYGKLCVKGSALHETMGEHGRLLYPKIAGQRVGWNEAIDTVAGRFADIRAKYGPNAIAFYLSGQLLTEDYYVANKLAKGFIGTNNVDTNSRLCMASAVAAHKRAFGADVVPGNYEDLEECNLLILSGSNAAWTHPILYQRMVAAKRARPQMRVVVIDPRRTPTCDLADLHLAIHPGSDIPLYAGLLKYLAENNCLDEGYIASYTNGFDDALGRAKVWDLDSVANATGESLETLAEFYALFAQTSKTVTFYSQGVNQSSRGADQCNAIINCHLATGRIGKPGTGPFSITGQPNAMGGREVGGLANQLASHMDYGEDTCAIVAGFWRAPSIAREPGRKAVDLFQAVGSGDIKAIWIMGTNPVVSMPDADAVKETLENCELVIVSDCYEHTDTTEVADILLPALGWGEKCGTVTNSERRISRQRKLVPAPGEAKADWWIMTQVAQSLGYTEAFHYEKPYQIFLEHAELSGYQNDGQRLFDISGLKDLSAAEYDLLEPIQWPVNAANPRGTARLFQSDTFATADGKANFVSMGVDNINAASNNDGKTYPLILNTGRIRDQWHTMTRTGRSSRLLNHLASPYALMHSKTAAEYGVEYSQLIRISSDHGYVVVEAQIDDGMKVGELFMPIHWAACNAADARVGAVIPAKVDPISGQPEFKMAAVKIETIASTRWALVISRNELDLSSFLNWTLVSPSSQGYYGYLVAIDEDFSWIDYWSDLGITEQDYASYIDEAELDERFICYADGAINMAVYSHPKKTALPSLEWVAALLEQRFEGSPWSLLAGRDLDYRDEGRTVCSCFQVGENRIAEAILSGADSAEMLGRELQCGTNCGSCIPELNELIGQITEIKTARVA